MESNERVITGAVEEKCLAHSSNYIEHATKWLHSNNFANKEPTFLLYYVHCWQWMVEYTVPANLGHRMIRECRLQYYRVAVEPAWMPWSHRSAGWDWCSPSSCHCWTSRSVPAASRSRCAVCSSHCRCSVHSGTATTAEHMKGCFFKVQHWNADYSKKTML